jgi:hypothetical protein
MAGGTTPHLIGVDFKAMYPDNILLWPDGFWCFREEYDPSFLRDDNYRVIVHQSEEWLRVQRINPILPPTR